MSVGFHIRNYVNKVNHITFIYAEKQLPIIQYSWFCENKPFNKMAAGLLRYTAVTRAS